MMAHRISAWCAAWLVVASGAAGVATADVDVGNVAVMVGDATIVQPAKPFDLDGRTLTFTPRPGGGCTVAPGPLEFDADLGSNLGLADNGSATVVPGFTPRLHGIGWGSVFVNANGNPTFGTASSLTHFNTSGTPASMGNLASLFTRHASGPPRIAALWQDWNPAAGGGVFARSLPDRLVVTWSAVPLAGTASFATFQVVLSSSGVIRMSYPDVAFTPAGGFLAGLSPGSASEFQLTVVDYGAGSGGSQTQAPGAEPLGHVYGTSTTPMVHIPMLARRYYASHPDDVDQMVLFGAFPFSHYAFAYELTLRQTVTGIGLGRVEGGTFLGSEARLQSFVNMGKLTAYPTDPFQTFLGTNTTHDVLGQETGHQWLAFPRFDDGGVCSDLLLGRDLAHWSFFFDSDASNMEGNRWVANGDGTFTTVDSTSRFSAMDPYMMGLRDPGDVFPAMLVRNPTGTTFNRSSAPRVGVTAGGTRRDVSLEQVRNCHGPRSPAAGFSAINPSQTWRQAFVMVVAPGTAPAAADLAKMDAIRGYWEPYFATAVSGRGAVDTVINPLLPDLAVSAISNVPAALARGAAFSVDETTENVGTTVAAASLTRYYLSLDTRKGSGDTLLAATRAVGSLDPGASSAASISLIAPSGMAFGTYYLLACADDLDAVVEATPANDCRASDAPMLVSAPDLVTSVVGDPPGTIAAGGTFAVTDTVANTGTGPAVATSVRYWLSADTVLSTATDIALTWSRPVPALVSGGTSSGTVTVTVPTSAAPGSYFLLACADGGGAAVESSETNNCLAGGTVLTLQRADLVVNALGDPPASVNAGTPMSLSDTVANVGSGAAPVSTVRYWLSLDQAVTSSDFLLSGSRSVPAVPAGGVSEGSVASTVPGAVPTGSYFLAACADGGGLIPEISETNNCLFAAGKVQVTKPDLSVAAVSSPPADSGSAVVEANETNNCLFASAPVQVTASDLVTTLVSDPPATALPGASFPVTDGVLNQGNAGAPASSVRYRLSIDAVITSADPVLTGSREVAALAPGAANSGSMTVTVPATVAPGLYFLFACADGGGAAPESNETNNCAAAAGRIQIGP